MPEFFVQSKCAIALTSPWFTRMKLGRTRSYPTSEINQRENQDYLRRRRTNKRKPESIDRKKD